MRGLILLLSVLSFVGCSRPEILPSDIRPVVVSMHRPEHEPRDSTFDVEWRFRIAEGWHLYWDGLNDSGVPPRVELDLPDGWSADPPRWPMPERHVSPGGILDHVYFDDLTLVQTVRWTDDYESAFGAKLTWLACRELCVFGDTTLVSQDALPTGESVVYDERLPLPPGRFDRTWRGNTLDLTFETADRLEFMPASDCGWLEDIVGDGAVDGRRLSLRFVARDGRYGPARGFLKLVRSGSATEWLIDIPAVPVAGPDPGGE